MSIPNICPQDPQELPPDYYDYEEFDYTIDDEDLIKETLE